MLETNPKIPAAVRDAGSLALEQALGHWVALKDDFPEELRYRFEMGKAYEHLYDYHFLAFGQLRKTEPGAAGKHLDRVVEIRREILKVNAADVRFRTNLAEALAMNAMFRAEQADHMTASAAARESAMLVEPSWPKYFIVGTALAKCLANADADKNLNAEEKEKLTKAYGEQALRIFTDSLASGWDGAKFLQGHRDLEALRTHPEFRAAFAELTKKK
jgi:hypothetical protein